MTIEVVKILHSIIVPLFIMIVIWRASMSSFKQFVDALHSPGSSVMMGYVLLLTGIIMMKVMLYDDGKYVVGAGVSLLVKSLNGTEKANASTTISETPGPAGVAKEDPAV